MPDSNDVKAEEQLKVDLIGVVKRMRKVNMGALLDGIIHSEYFALERIYRYGQEHPKDRGIYVSDLAKNMHIASSATSRILHSLEQKGLIVRETDHNDRRNTCVMLTEEGVGMRNLAARKMNEYEEQIIHRMGTQDIHRLIELWDQFTDVMEESLEYMLNQEHTK